MPTASAATGFIGRVGLANPNATSYAGTEKVGTIYRLLNKTLNRSHGNRRTKATLLALTGAAVGAASKAYSNSRVAAATTRGAVGGGGKRTVETVTYQTGVTVAGDLTNIDQAIATKSYPSSYPVDRSGHVPGNIGKFG